MELTRLTTYRFLLTAQEIAEPGNFLDDLLDARQSYIDENKAEIVKEGIVICHCYIREDPDIIGIAVIQNIENIRPYCWGHRENQEKFLLRRGARNKGVKPLSAKYKIG